MTTWSNLFWNIKNYLYNFEGSVTSIGFPSSSFNIWSQFNTKIKSKETARWYHSNPSLLQVLKKKKKKKKKVLERLPFSQIPTVLFKHAKSTKIIFPT